MHKWYSISFTDREGEQVEFSLWRRISAPSVEVFPVYGYSLKFNLPRFGYGGLNRELTLDIVDEDREFFSLFNNSNKSDLEVRIEIGGRRFMLAVPDLQQIQIREFEEGKTGIRVVFYEAYQFKKQSRWDSPVVQNRIYDRAEDNPNFINTDWLFRNIVFDDYKDSPTLAGDERTERLYYNSYLFSFPNAVRELGQGLGSPSLERNTLVMANWLYFRKSAFLNAVFGVGTITTTTNDAVTGTGTTFTNFSVGDLIYDENFELIGEIQTINSNTSITLVDNAQKAVTGSRFYINYTAGNASILDVTDILCNLLSLRYGYSFLYEGMMFTQGNSGWFDGKLRAQFTSLPAQALGNYWSDRVIETPLSQGTITASGTSDVLTGVGTNFTALVPGDRIFAAIVTDSPPDGVTSANEVGVVQSVTNDTQLTLTSDAFFDITGAKFYVNLEFERDLPKIEKDKIVIDATAQEYAPLRRITYSVDDSFITLSPAVSRTNNIFDSELFNDREVSLPVSLSGAENARSIFTRSFSDALSEYNALTDLEIQGLTVDDLPVAGTARRALQVLSEIDARFRFPAQKNLQFRYLGLLDPMMPYETDYDFNVYTIIEGEYDLLARQTIVTQSITNYTTLDRGLVARYRFNEGSGSIAKDSAFIPNNGTITGATYVQGVSGTGLEFDGGTSRVAIPHNANQLLTGGGTISAFIRPNGFGGVGAGRIVDKSTGTDIQNGYGLRIQLNTLRFRINSGGTIISSTPIDAFQTYHVVATFDTAGNALLFINGVQVGSGTTGSASGITTTNDLRIGNRSNATDRGFDGLIDEVRIYNRVLSLEEIQYLYKNKV